MTETNVDEAIWTAMNPRIKQRWVKALRSGKYSQGHGRLRALVNGVFYYCCMGVLTELYIRSKAGKEAGARWGATHDYPDVSSFYSKHQHPEGERSFLPSEVALWAGLLPDEDVVEHMGKSYCELTPEEEDKALYMIDGVNPQLTPVRTCAQCNDGGESGQRMSFAEIAKLIEQNY